jgi:hypothetical protein
MIPDEKRVDSIRLGNYFFHAGIITSKNWFEQLREQE